MKNNLLILGDRYISGGGDVNNKIVYYNRANNQYIIPMKKLPCNVAKKGVPILFCPWCGKVLHESKRELWFNELEKLGFDDPIEQNIPEKFKSSDWYKLN